MFTFDIFGYKIIYLSMARKVIKKHHKPKTMVEVSAGFEEFIKKRKKRNATKAGFDKLLIRVVKHSSK